MNTPAKTSLRFPKRTLLLLLYALLNLAWLFFIFRHSAASNAASSAESGLFMEWLSRLFSGVGLSIEMNTTIVRKCAHFFEHFILGLLFAGWIPICGKNSAESFLFPLSGSLLCALIDEGIQLFSDGRSAEVVDVWIDFSGGLLAALLLFLILALTGRKKKKQGGVKIYG